MKKHWRRLVATLLLVAVGVSVSLLVKSGEPIFRGKPESYWITNIVYHAPDDQIEQWRGFGLDGVQLLTQYLDRGHGWQNTYRTSYRRFAPRSPGFLVRLFPDPVDNGSTRMCVLDLVTALSWRDINIARIAEPTVARTMKDDNRALLLLALSFYDGILRHQRWKEEMLEQHFSPRMKKTRLRDFLRLVQHDDHWVRGNAAIVLSYFPDEAVTVTPVLIKVLAEPEPRIQLTIAKALAQVDHEAAAKAGVATIATNFLKNPDRQTVELAQRAAEVLGELHAEPSVSVPTLIEGLNATNREIAIASFRALARFVGQSPSVLPALRKAYERNDIPN